MDVADITPLLLTAASKPRISSVVLRRTPAYVVVGTADIGQLNWCEAKATFMQESMEPAFARRALQILRDRNAPPSFCTPHPQLVAMEALSPESRGTPMVPHEEPLWAKAEREETEGTWHMGFVAAIPGSETGLDQVRTIFLAGITDGVRGDGSVIEVRQTRWTWKKLRESTEVKAKETQANIYAVMLGLRSWTCIFRCSDRREVTEGSPDPERAMAEIAYAVSLRARIRAPVGVPEDLAGRCRAGCEFLPICDLSPARAGRRG